MGQIIIKPLAKFFQGLIARLKEPVWLSELGCGFSLILLGVFIAIMPEPTPQDSIGWPSLALLRSFFNHNDAFLVTTIIVIGLGQGGLFKRIDDTWHYPFLRWIASIFCGWVYSMIVISLISLALTPLIAPFVAIIAMNAGLAIRILIIGAIHPTLAK